GVQTEVAVAVDPSNPQVLFGASNESLEPEIRIYASKNAGRTWSESAGPQHNPNSCSWGDPSVAVARDGRQYVAFTEKSICVPGTDLTPYLVVGSRKRAGAAWTIRRVTRPATNFGFDDKPAISVGDDGRAYVVWSRLYGRKFQTTVISSSDDGGRTWSKPSIVHRQLVQPQLVTIAAGPRGVVYLAGVDAKGVWVGPSTDRRGPVVRVSAGCCSPARQPGRDVRHLREVRASATGREVPRSGPDDHDPQGPRLRHVRRQRRRPVAGRRSRRVRSGAAAAVARA